MKLIRGLLKLVVATGFGAVTYGALDELDARILAVPPYWTRHQDKQSPMNGSARLVIAITSAYGVWSGLGAVSNRLTKEVHR